MVVYLEPVSGTAKDNLERAKVEMERIVGFRGKVTGAKVEGSRIAVTIEINPKWDLPEAEKVSNLEEWIRAKTRVVFSIFSVQSIK
jgi:hypothetical protein